MKSLENLIEYLGRMPGIGKKSASRIAYHFLKTDQEYNENLGKAIKNIKLLVKHCSQCSCYTETDPCPICSSTDRDNNKMCVVESSQDVTNIEKTGEYGGLYHVLNGLLSPLEGIGPAELKLDKLVSRIDEHNISELIVATNPTVEGDTTALYIQRILNKKENLNITRLATGLPVGGDLEYADKMTLARSFKGRIKL